MIFNALTDSDERGELLLIDGGLCRFHARQDGTLVIHEIFVQRGRRSQGLGRELLARLVEAGRAAEATSIFARCPADLPSNGWYEHVGFESEGRERSRSGVWLNLWRLTLSTAQPATE